MVLPTNYLEAIKRASSGCGLSVVRQIVRMHNGFIKNESGNGNGTTLAPLLPTLDQHRADLRLPSAKPIREFKNGYVDSGTRLETGKFSSVVDGAELFFEIWKPKGILIGAIVLVHGLGEYMGRFLNLVNYFVPKGYAVYGFDLRGHGRSTGIRGHLQNWEDYASDLESFLKLNRLDPSKAFFFGQSLGGAIVLHWALTHQIRTRGVIALAPALGKTDVPEYGWALSKLFHRIWPTFQIAIRKDFSKMSRDLALVDALKNNSLAHNRATARFAVEYKVAVDFILSHAKELKVPALFLHGKADTIVDIQGTRDFFKSMNFPDKSLIEYPHAYHELLDDFDRDQVLQDMEFWIEEHRYEKS